MLAFNILSTFIRQIMKDNFWDNKIVDNYAEWLHDFALPLHILLKLMKIWQPTRMHR